MVHVSTVGADVVVTVMMNTDDLAHMRWVEDVLIMASCVWIVTAVATGSAHGPPLQHCMPQVGVRTTANRPQNRDDEQPWKSRSRHVLHPSLQR